MAKPDEPVRRGRPPRPSSHPLGRHLRERRERKGYTIRELATRVGLGPSAAGYISQLENGLKTPSERLAEALASALDDDPRLYEAWARLGKRADPAETARAVGVLQRLMGIEWPALQEAQARSVLGSRVDPLRRARSVEPTLGAGPAAFGERPSDLREQLVQELELARRQAKEARARASSEEEQRRRLERRIAAEQWAGRAVQADQARPTTAARGMFFAKLKGLLSGEPVPGVPQTRRAEAPPAWVVVPVVEFDVETGRPIEKRRLRLDPSLIPDSGRLARPFAIELTADAAERVWHELDAGDLAVVTGDPLPIDPGDIYVYRGRGMMPARLAHLMWNGRELLVMPREGQSDFEVLPAPDETALRRVVLGRVAFTIAGDAEPGPQ